MSDILCSNDKGETWFEICFECEKARKHGETDCGKHNAFYSEKELEKLRELFRS